MSSTVQEVPTVAGSTENREGQRTSFFRSASMLALVSLVSFSAITNLFGLKYEKKPAKQRFRWNLLWQVLVLAAVYPAFAAFKTACAAIGYTTFGVQIVSAFFYTIGAVSVWLYIFRVRRNCTTDWNMRAIQEFGREQADAVKHIFVMPVYKEPMEVIMASLDTLATQTIAQKIVVCVTMEQGTPDVIKKKEQLSDKYGPQFGKFIATTHPKGIDGEIPGACSNRNWGCRRALHILDEEGSVDVENTLITVCDSDTLFHPKYAECLTHGFLSDPDRQNICYQSPLFYNIDLDKSYFFTRCTAIIRAFTMVGFLIPMNINTMSIYSVPLQMLLQSKFFHPGYQMDDIIFTLSAMQSIGKLVRIRMIEVPTLSGPTSGSSFWDELGEWYKQTKRWTIGAGEVFHYFMVKWLKGKFSLASGLGYGFWLTYYYAYVLCAAGMITLVHFITEIVLSSIPQGVNFNMCMEDTWVGFYGQLSPAYLWWSLQAYIWVIFFGTAMVLDCRIVRLLKLEEQINCFRRVLHFIAMPLVLWLYCLVEYWSIFLLTIYGKAVCGHAPSKKDALIKVDTETTSEASTDIEEGSAGSSSSESGATDVPAQ